MDRDKFLAGLKAEEQIRKRMLAAHEAMQRASAEEARKRAAKKAKKGKGR